MQWLLDNRLVVACVAWLVTRFSRRPLRLFLPVHFHDREAWSVDLPALRLVIGSSREVVQQVLVKGAQQYPKSRVMQPLLCPLIGRGLFAADGPDVAGIRRMFVRAIAQVPDRTIVAATQSLFDEYRDRWQREGTLERLPVSSEMSRLTVDIVSECLFHARFTESESAEFTALFFRYQFQASPLRLFPWTGGRVFAPLRQARQQRIARRMRELMRTRFAARLRDPSSPLASSPFALAVGERERAGAEPLDEERLLDEVAVMLLAGHETSASALSWLLRQLAGDAELQQRLRLEAGEDANGSLTRSVINEVLRLYPPIPLYARDARAADSIGDMPIPPGTLVLVPPWVIHRHASLWDEPLAFRSDRFQSLSAGETANRFLPFGSGARACPGSRFAMTEMQTLVAAIVRTFRLRALPGRAVQPLGNLTTRPDHEIYIALEGLS